ncbi:hypothetical protein [Geodermatophilus sp. SYSU D01176]
MPRTTTRAATLTGLTATTVATGLLLAPAALAAPLTTPTAPSTATAGAPFQVSGTGCVADDAQNPDWVAFAVVVTDLADFEAAEPTGVFLAEPAEDGSWSTAVSFPAGTTGTHSLYAACATSYAGEPVEYPEITVSVSSGTSTPVTETPTTTTPTPTTAAPPATTAPTYVVRGTQANTPGVASPDEGSATGDSAAPGRKVVKVLTGFKPGEVVTVTLHSTPQTVGTFTADGTGTVTASFTVPAGTPTGDHTLVYEGNMGTYFQESFTVTAAATTSNPSSSSLAYTGADIALPLGLGVGALALGGGLVFAARRRAAEGSQV